MLLPEPKPIEVTTFENSFSEVYKVMLEKDIEILTTLIVDTVGEGISFQTPFTIYRYLGVLMESLELSANLCDAFGGPIANLYRACCNLLISIRSDNTTFDKFSRMELKDLAGFLARCSMLALGGEQFEKAVKEVVNIKPVV